MLNNSGISHNVAEWCYVEKLKWIICQIAKKLLLKSSKFISNGL